MKKSVLILPLLSLCLLGCREESTPSEKSILVKVTEVGDSFTSYSRSYVGTVTASKEHLLFSTHNGTVEQMNIKVGQKIPQYYPMVSVSSPNVRSLDKSSQATLRQAKDGYERAKKLYEGGGLSEIKWMEVQTKLAQAESAAEISSKSLEDCVTKAPFSGTVSEVFVSLGEEISVGQRLATIIDESDLKVRISIPENEYSNVKEGTHATVVVTALDNLTLDSVVEDLGVNSTSLSHSYVAKLNLRKYPTSLKSGMACKVYLQTDLKNRVVIPANVVKTDDNGRYVWIVNSDDKVEKRHVTTNGFAEKGVSISSGLFSGDKVIVEGISKVSTGMKVETQVKIMD